MFLADRTEEDWARLLTYTETRRFGAGEVIIRAGETERALYVVVDGHLEILLPNENGDLRFATVGPRSVIGEVAFLDGLPRSATIRAVTDGELVRLSVDSYEILAARYPELGRAIALDLGRILAARLREMNETLRRETA